MKRTYGHLLLYTGVISCPFSVALSKTLLGAFTLLSLYKSFKLGKVGQFFFPKDFDNLRTYSLISIYCLFFTFFTSSFFGIDFFNSISEFGKSFVWFLFFLSIINKTKTNHKIISNIILCLIIGSLVASLHTLIFGGEQVSHRFRPPGPLTESGLLVLIIPLAIYFLYTKRSLELKQYILFIVPLLLLNLALFINIKRGPIISVVIELLILSFFAIYFQKKRDNNQINKRVLALFLILIVFSGVIILSSPEFISRFNSIWQHFTIAGGRQELWEIGKEVISLNPLGVGLDNSDIIRTYYPSIPPSHKHLHNTILNITLETGFIGLCAYLLFNFFIIIALFKDCLKYKDTSSLSLFLLISVIGFNIAGVFEYNFGDGEIRNVFWIILALAITVATNKKA